MKDMPSSLPPNLTISAVSKSVILNSNHSEYHISITILQIFRREDPADAVVMHPKNFGKRLEDLEDGRLINGWLWFDIFFALDSS